MTVVTEALLPFGLDIVQPFDVSLYNDLSSTNTNLIALPDFGRRRTLGLLIGNTRLLWPPFIEAFHNAPKLNDNPDPLDSYVESAIKNGVDQLQASVETGAEIRFGHHLGAQFVSLVHLAQLSSLATISPVQMAVHPQYGLWFGLRAAMILDADFVDTASTDEDSAHEENADEDGKTSSPCHGCDAPCKATLDRLTANEQQVDEADQWQRWVQVRDACPVGRQMRYSDEQVQYHHSKDQKLILKQ